MKWPDVMNNLLHYVAFGALGLGWYYVATQPIAATPAGGQLILAIQGAMATVAGVKGVKALRGSLSQPVGNAPPNQQAGFARPQLLGLVGALGLVTAMVAGCAGLSTQGPTTQGPVTAASQAQQSYLQAMTAHNNACGAWEAVYQTATQIRASGHASPTLIQQIDLLSSQLNPPCSPPFPKTAAEITAQTTQVLASVGILETIVKETKQ